MSESWPYPNALHTCQVGAPECSGQRSAERFHHHGQAITLVAARLLLSAQRHQGLGDIGVRFWQSCLVHDEAMGQRLSSAASIFQLAIRNGTGGHVEDEWRFT